MNTFHNTTKHTTHFLKIPSHLKNRNFTKNPTQTPLSPKPPLTPLLPSLTPYPSTHPPKASPPSPLKLFCHKEFNPLKSATDLKNKVLRKTELEILLEEATNSDSWNVTNTKLQQIADFTEDWNNYNLVMKHLWETVNLEMKYHVNIFKGLHLMEFLVKNGNERIIQDLKDDIRKIRTLQDCTHHVDGIDK